MTTYTVKTTSNTALVNTLFNWNDPVMWFAAIVATVLHLSLIFLITFAIPNAQDSAMQDVTIAVHLVKNQKVEEADYLAQANQLGAGLLKTAHRLTNPDVSENQALQMDLVNPNSSSSAAKEEETEAADHQVITTTLSWDKQEAQQGKKVVQKNKPADQKIDSTAAMIATLEAEYALTKQEYSKQSNIHTVDSVSAKADNSAPYLNEFRSTVEKMGNRHYPEEAKNQNLSGDVRLMVILSPNGEVQAIRLLRSSGSKILDEAAKSSVRYGAPYPKFTTEMQDLTQLRIIRTWRFSPASTTPEIMP